MPKWLLCPHNREFILYNSRSLPTNLQSTVMKLVYITIARSKNLHIKGHRVEGHSSSPLMSIVELEDVLGPAISGGCLLSEAILYGMWVLSTVFQRLACTECGYCCLLGSCPLSEVTLYGMWVLSSVGRLSSFRGYPVRNVGTVVCWEVVLSQRLSCMECGYCCLLGGCPLSEVILYGMWVLSSVGRLSSFRGYPVQNVGTVLCWEAVVIWREIMLYTLVSQSRSQLSPHTHNTS
jgi:hypothetical protein